jgi:hypothetical protein
MLVISNGNFKSGSTWVTAVIKVAVPHKEIPEQYAHPKHRQRLALGKIAPFLREVDIQRDNYVSKTHIFDRSTIRQIVEAPGVRVVNVERDLRDALVSHYHHLLRIGKGISDFGLYYRLIGRYKAIQILRYRAAWEKWGHGHLLVTYEDMIADPHRESAKIAAYLGVDLSRDRLDHIVEATKIESLRKRSKEIGLSEEASFFRRGAVGDHREYLSDAQHQELRSFERGQIPVWHRMIYAALFEVRVGLKRWLQGVSKHLYLFLDRHV